MDAIHPGYGFLSESPEFAEACEQNGITFIGPTVENLRSFSDKTTAREMAIAAGVSVVPGTDGAVTSTEQAENFVKVCPECPPAHAFAHHAHGCLSRMHLQACDPHLT